MKIKSWLWTAPAVAWLLSLGVFIRYEILAGPGCEFDLTVPYLMVMFIQTMLTVVTAVNISVQLGRYLIVLAFWIVAGMLWSAFEPSLICIAP